MVGDTFKENAVLREDGVFYNFGVIPKLRSIFGVKPNEPIYEVEFEVVEEKAQRPTGHTNDIMYYALYDKHSFMGPKYSLIQPTAEMFAMQFPWDVWKHQGELKGTDILGNELYFGIVVHIKPKSYTQINEENENKKD